MDPVLQVRQLCTSLFMDSNRYPVVDRVSFDLHRGKTLALVGESGCGKTMTALSLLKLLPENPIIHEIEGKVLFQGQNLVTLAESKMRKIRGGKIAIIFQDPTNALNPVYPIGSQMSESAELHLGLDREKARDKSLAALAEVGIASPAEILNAYPHQLSGGMKQRVMIAMALLCEPDVLIADEPTTALDVTIQAQVLDRIRNLQKKKGMALLLITHDMGVVAEIADQVVVMYASQIVETADVETIFDKRAHPYTLALFNSRTTLEAARGTLQAIPGNVPSLSHYPHGCRFHPRCPFIMQKCRHGQVPDFRLEPQHTAKCWLYDGTKESQERKLNERATSGS